MPHCEPWHVKPVVPPQVWSGVTVRVEVGDAEADLVVVVELVFDVVEVVLDEVADVDEVLEVEDGTDPPPPALRYQFAGGSPRHSPTVTIRYPRETLV